MYGIKILEREHDNIIEFVDKMEEICVRILGGEELNVNIFRRGILFIREYADGHHHEKEEDVIFKYMMDNLGEKAVFLVRNGMMVEHDLARLHVIDMEEYLNNYEESKKDIDKLGIISNMMGYVYLLRRHVDKENKVVYTFAKNNLEDRHIKEIDKKTKELELLAKENGIVDRQLEFLKELKEY